MTEPTSGEHEAVDRVLRDAGARLRAQRPTRPRRRRRGSSSTIVAPVAGGCGGWRRSCWPPRPRPSSPSSSSRGPTRPSATSPADTPAPRIAATMPAPTIAATVPTPPGAAPDIVPAPATVPPTTAPTTSPPTTNSAKPTPVPRVIVADPPIQPAATPELLYEAGTGAAVNELGPEDCQECDPSRPLSPVVTWVAR
jgi:hypothetical protein